MKSSVVVKLWLAITTLALGVLLVLGVVAIGQMEGLYDFHLSEHMLGQARGLIDLYRPEPEAPGDKPWASLEPVLGARIITLSNQNLAALSQAPVDGELPREMAERLLAGETVTFRTRPSALLDIDELPCHVPGTEQHVFVAGVPILRDGGQMGALLLVAPVSPVAETVEHFRQIVVATVGAMLVGVTLLALVLSRRLARPLRAMIAMARAMAGGDFGQRVSVIGEDEVGRLGESINRLADSLDASLRQLAERNARLSGILSSMSEGVMLVDAAGQLYVLNPPAKALVRGAGLEADQVGDWAWLRLLGIDSAVRRVLSEGRSLGQRLRVGGAAYEVSLSPVPDEQGFGVVMVWQDITQEERLEEMRRDFVANVSHEMRTPIGLIRGYVEAMQDGLAESAAERNEMLGIMREELDRLAALIRDLLHLARLDAGQVRLELEPVSLSALVPHLVRKMAPLIEQAGVAVRAEIPPDLPLTLADADQVEQVLLNLLDNALRHTPAGKGVTIRAEADGDRVQIRVEDQGSGIPPQERHLVWERFYRGDPAHSRKKGGTGLGLAIVRGIVTAHGGQVWVEEAPGGGCSFRFTLPQSLS